MWRCCLRAPRLTFCYILPNRLLNSNHGVQGNHYGAMGFADVRCHQCVTRDADAVLAQYHTSQLLLMDICNSTFACWLARRKRNTSLIMSCSSGPDM